MTIASDAVGRNFCGPHKKDMCHICGMDFRMTNELAEIRAGLRPEPTKLQKLAEERTILQRGISFMRGPAGVPPVMKANYDFHVQQLAKVEKEIEELTKAESDRKELEEATAKSRAKYASQDADTRR
ncbi:hypothetical protein BCR33DRAFT_856508 [Rhizoclosmatium globosum]|uniref:Uncharacterized protein n=1 Tax=Rhizoclosmatium globosum TaxID=329046 RepID=A0A1Y2BCI1_9FUNG|nr:hypothetical protein BCR33DRAFT_856508 [Rhizoclosmatium globosum]|eukprot:ORY32416.1 hypothetical protein BCR33DRAFT_856508 [Rhizoclosmatium globosum]